MLSTEAGEEMEEREEREEGESYAVNETREHSREPSSAGCEAAR